MKATLENLRKALKASAQAHNAEYQDWEDEGQIGIRSETPATVNDIRMILEAFYGSAGVRLCDVGYGYTTVYIYDFMEDPGRNVNEGLLGLALPHGTKL